MSRIYLNLVVLLTWVGLAGLTFAESPCPHCQAPDGGCWEEIVTHRCKLVPDVKKIKKTVYECRDVPYCQHALPKFGHCDCCPECECPKYKKVLVKKEVVCEEICGTKCVVEEVIQRVPRPCCHCGHCADSPSPSDLPPSPAAEDSALRQPQRSSLAPVVFATTRKK